MQRRSEEIRESTLQQTLARHKLRGISLCASCLSVCPSHILKLRHPYLPPIAVPSLRPGIRVWRIFSSLLCCTHELVTPNFLPSFNFPRSPVSLLANSFQRCHIRQLLDGQS